MAKSISSFPEGGVALRFTGRHIDYGKYRGGQGRVYMAGNNSGGRVIHAHPDDVKVLVKRGDFEEIEVEDEEPGKENQVATWEDVASALGPKATGQLAAIEIESLETLPEDLTELKDIISDPALARLTEALA